MALAVARASHSVSDLAGRAALLRGLAPPSAIVHVGAGTGAGAMDAWLQWDVASAWIFDADRERLFWLDALLANRPSWHRLAMVLAEVEGEVLFHHASNPAEDGLVPAAQLQAYWPNISNSSSALRQTRRLDNVLAELGDGEFNAAGHVWCLVDCIPALPILEGAGRHLEDWSVLWLRVLLRPSQEIEQGASLDHLERHLSALGFRCVDVTESNHPAFGHALFVRDWLDATRQGLEHLLREQQRTTQQQHLLGLHQATIEGLRQEHESHMAQAAQLRQQLDAASRTHVALQGDNALLAESLDQRTMELASLIQGQAELTRENAGLLESNRQIQLERDAHAGKVDALKIELGDLGGLHASALRSHTGQMELLAGRQQEIDSLAAAQTLLVEEKEQLLASCQQWGEERISYVARIDALQARATESAALQVAAESARVQTTGQLEQREAELGQLRQEAGQLGAQLLEVQSSLNGLTQVQAALHAKEEHFGKLEADSMELERRQQRIAQEMLRAGAQVDLIKDILVQGTLLADHAMASAPVPVAKQTRRKLPAQSPGRRKQPRT